MQPDLSPRITLHILRGRASQKSRVMAGQSLLIGSDARCDVQMRAANVAPRHCLISRSGEGVLATRLSAEHPLLVNGAPAAEEQLKDGDVLAIGPFELRVEFSNVEAQTNGHAAAKLPAEEPPAMHRPRFALLDRKPTVPAPTPPVVETAFAKPESPPVEDAEALQRREQLAESARLNDLREEELRSKDERLQDWANRLETQEGEIELARKECAEAILECQQQRRTLEDRRAKVLALRAKSRSERREQNSRFANLLADAERRTKSLDERERNLEGREERWRRIAEEIDARQATVESRERQAAEELARLERRREILHRERGMLDKEWRRLFARQQEVVEQKETLDRRAERVAVEETLLAQSRKRSRSELAALQQLSEKAAVQSAEIDARSVKLRGRERALDERAHNLASVDQQLRDRETELDVQAEILQRRAAETQQQIELQQRSIDEQRADLEAELARHESDKKSLQRRQEVWKTEVLSLSKAKEQLDQRTSLLAARELALDDLKKKGHDPAELDRRFKELRREQDKVVAEAGEAAQRRRKLDAETTKLAEIARELSERQRELTEREHRLAESAAEEHESLDREAERLQQEKAALDARADEQRRHWEKLKSSAARFGSRRKVLLERLSDLETKFEDCKREIEHLVESRLRLRASLEDYAMQAERREREAMEWLRGVQAESEAVADAHRRFTRLFDVVVGTAAPVGLRSSLGDWSHRMTKLQRHISSGEQVLKSPTPTSEVISETPAVEVRSKDTEPEATILTLPKAEAPVAAPVPPKWLFKLVELGLADEEVLNYLLVNARERKASVEDALVEQGIITRWQLACISENRFDRLQIGDARIVDLLHEGTVATTYLVNIPTIEKSAALRLLHPNILTTEEAKAAYLEHVQAMTRFRHPAAASVLGPFEHGGGIGVLYEYVAGRSLLKAGASMTPAEVIGCFRQCLTVLFAGQRAGFLHRSLRPSRIMATSLGLTILLGFGEPDWLIRLHRSERKQPDDYYVAPEDLALGKQVDARADLFSLCRIFMEVVLGRRPSPGESIASPAGYSDALLELLVRGMNGDPGARCRSFADVIHEVDSWQTGGQLANSSPVPKTISRTAA